MLTAFNVGAQGLLGKGHTLGDDIRAGNCDHAPIAKEFANLPGDAKRHSTEGAVFNHGVYPRPRTFP
jgi:hypothetical protein